LSDVERKALQWAATLITVVGLGRIVGRYLFS
jgi:hypothetical protein